MAIDSDNLDKFPDSPDDQQIFVDNDGNQWVYDIHTDSWEFSGPKLNINLASGTETGLLSPQFKLLLDTIAQYPGAFGIIVDKPYKQTIEGNIKFVSNSLDISCLNSRGVNIGAESGCGEETTVSCSGDVLENDIATLPRFEIKLREAYLERLCIDLPSPKGPIGRTGPDGEKGEDGFGDGPKGLTGEPGPNVNELLELRNIIIQDNSTLTNDVIVDLELVDRGQGPFFKVLRSRRTLSANECALRLRTSAIARTLTFNSPITDNSCSLSGLNGWSINKVGNDPLPAAPFLIRTSDDETEDCSTVFAFSMEQFIESVINEYEKEIVKLDQDWARQTKQHIEALDDRARKILSNLADELARCESTLAGTEFGITFERCPPSSPSSPSTLSLARNGQVGSIEASGKKWEIVS